MGYRSDVYLKTTKEGYKKIRQILNENDDGFELFTCPDDMKIETTPNKEYFITMKWEDRKWYDGYEDVDALMDAIDKISDEEPIHFMRLGESVDDVEERYQEPDGYRGDFYGLEFIRTVQTYGKYITDDDIIDNE
jgi:hypothetical protein